MIYSLLKHKSILNTFLGFQRGYITEEGIRKWFKDLQTFLQLEHNLDANDLFSASNAERIFNADESGFPLQGKLILRQLVSIL